MPDLLRVVHLGLGPIGRGVVEVLLARPDLRLVGTIDLDPRHQGRDVGELLGRDQVGVRVEKDVGALLGRVEADVAVVTTTSKLQDVERTLVALCQRGLHVVSTCEELVYPWRRQADVAARIDEAAKRAGVSVLGTGVNPGFLMDYVPLMCTGVCRSVRSVRVERFQDAALRRRPFQDKVGVGRTPEEFQGLVREGALRHVGLAESVDMIAATLGAALDDVEETIAPILATTRLEHGGVVVEAGQVRGVEQKGTGRAGGVPLVTLHFRAAFLEEDVRDRVLIDGDPPVELSFPGGVHGDSATCALAVNSIQAVVRARPGLRTMADVELVASRYRR